jgi:acyl-CoA hydrolase
VVYDAKRAANSFASPGWFAVQARGFQPGRRTTLMPTLMDTYLENRWEVQPNHSNNFGSAHGGNVMKWLDGLGGLSAMRFAGETCVTAKMDELNFERPIPVGETALVESYVYEAGRTSVEVRLRAYREDPRTGETELTTSSYATYVAVDDTNTPTPVPALDVTTDEGRRLQRAALDAHPDREA